MFLRIICHICQQKVWHLALLNMVLGQFLFSDLTIIDFALFVLQGSGIGVIIIAVIL